MWEKMFVYEQQKCEKIINFFWNSKHDAYCNVTARQQGRQQDNAFLVHYDIHRQSGYVS